MGSKICSVIHVLGPKKSWNMEKRFLCFFYTQLYTKEYVAGFLECEFISIYFIRQQSRPHKLYKCCRIFMLISTLRLLQRQYCFYQPCIMTFINKQPAIRITHLSHLCNFAQLHISIPVILLQKHVKIIPSSIIGKEHILL